MLPNTIDAQLAQFKNIPDELKALRQWVLWRKEDIGASKPTKIPYQVNGHKASVVVPQNWSAFDDVCEVFKSGHYSGIGFVFTVNDPFVFVDLDKAPDQLTMDRQLKVFKLSIVTPNFRLQMKVYISLRKAIIFPMEESDTQLKFIQTGVMQRSRVKFIMVWAYKNAAMKSFLFGNN